VVTRALEEFQMRRERKRADAELKRHIHDLEQFKKLAVGRELRMIELKKEVNVLCRELGKPERYD